MFQTLLVIFSLGEYKPSFICFFFVETWTNPIESSKRRKTFDQNAGDASIITDISRRLKGHKNNLK